MAPTSPLDGFQRLVKPTLDLPTLTTDTINPGDPLFWSDGDSAYRPMTAANQGRLFRGVSHGQNPIASGIDNSNPSVSNKFMPTQQVGDTSMITTNGETYHEGDPLYINVAQNIQTITKVAPGGTTTADIVGFAHLVDGVQVAGDGSKRIFMTIRINFPDPTLAG